jgi:hypothetical protein
MAVTGRSIDQMVEAIFDSVRRKQGSPEERRSAIVRAGVIAQAYQGELLVDALFSFEGDGALHHNNDLHL